MMMVTLVTLHTWMMMTFVSFASSLDLILIKILVSRKDWHERLNHAPAKVLKITIGDNLSSASFYNFNSENEKITGQKQPHGKMRASPYESSTRMLDDADPYAYEQETKYSYYLWCVHWLFVKNTYS